MRQLTVTMAPWILAAVLFTVGRAQVDSVDVTFRYTISGQTSVSVPGEFNGWAPANGLMTNAGGNLWVRTVRLRVGGNPNPPPVGVPGAWQYKFYYPGASPWPNDPLNHHENPLDNNNSFLYVKHPTIYQLIPNQRTGSLNTSLPPISVYLYPKVGSVVDTSALTITIDTTTYTGLGSAYNFATQQLNFTPTTPLPDGSHVMILNAGTNADTVSFITATGGPIILPMPPYAKNGVTLPSAASNDSTTFRLRVSATTFVVVRIAPAGQPVSSAQGYFMRKNITSDDWWLNVALAPGTYEYQYQTASGYQINDPWGRYSGTYGSRFTIGPEGLSADDYVWNTTNFQRPPLNKLVIYEMHVGEFGGGYYGLPAGQSGFTQLATLMDHFDSLGVNAIELMPVMDYGGMGRSGFSWGYDISSAFALEPAYGTPREFKALVDSAHSHGVAVILDVVFNHQNDAGPLWQMQPSTATSLYFKECSDLRHNEDQLCFFRDLDHWKPGTQELVYESLKMWLDVYKVDGFRYDYTQGIGWDVSQPTWGILGWANRIAQDYNNTVYQIAEHLPESPALIYYSGLTGGWHGSFRSRVFDDARFQNVPLSDFENLVLGLGAFPGNDVPALPDHYQNRTEPVNDNVNHDEQSLIYEMSTFQGVPIDTAVRRDKLYATFMFASLGIPMLWEGMEFSAPRGWIDGNQRLSYRPVEWNFFPTPRGQAHLRYYKALIRQRLHNPALTDGVLRTLFRYDSQRTLVWGFEDSTSGAKFMAVANLSPTDQTITNVPWLAAGNWYDIWDQSVFTAGDTTLASFTVPTYSAKCYSSVPDSILLEVKEPPAGLPTSYALDQNYPNPFNPSTTIRFELPEEARVTLVVYDVLGREVARLADEVFPAGSYTRVWNGRNASGTPVGSGMYFCRMVVTGGSAPGGNVFVRKMMVLK